MSNFGDLIEVFKMEELSVLDRVEVIWMLALAIDYEYASNVATPIADKLIKILQEKYRLTEQDIKDAKCRGGGIRCFRVE